jgi:hypothetical protein
MRNACLLQISAAKFFFSTLLSLDLNMWSIDDQDNTTQVNTGFLEAVLSAIVMGSKCKIDIFKGNIPTEGRAHWPKKTFCHV